MPSKPWTCAFSLSGTVNGESLSASGRCEGADGVAEVSAVMTEGAALRHSTWIWGSFSHFGLAFMPDGRVKNPCESHPHHVTRNWRAEDGAHIWSSHDVSGGEGQWQSDIHCLGDSFDPHGPIMRRKILGQLPSHWIATARSEREVDVHGIVTYQLEGGSSYAVHIHDLIVFEEPCVELTRHYWKLDIADGEYHPDHWWHKEIAVVDTCWNLGPNKDKMSFSWSLCGSINDKSLEASGFGFGSGFRQHQWGKGGKGFVGAGLPNLAWALAWEGHAGLHFFTRFPRGVVNPFILALPDGFVIHRKWFGHDGAHWTSTHDVRFADGIISKKVVLMGADFPENGVMMTSSGAPSANLIVRSFPQYILAVPKGDDHIWYRSCFQFQLQNGTFYSGYWEMDVRCRKKIQMPAPFMVRLAEETWESDGNGWSFYVREEVEPSTYDISPEREKRSRAMTGSIHVPQTPTLSDSSSTAETPQTPQIQAMAATKERAAKSGGKTEEKVDEQREKGAKMEKAPLEALVEEAAPVECAVTRKVEGDIAEEGKVGKGYEEEAEGAKEEKAQVEAVKMEEGKAANEGESPGKANDDESEGNEPKEDQHSAETEKKTAAAEVTATAAVETLPGEESEAAVAEKKDAPSETTEILNADADETLRAEVVAKTDIAARTDERAETDVVVEGKAAVLIDVAAERKPEAKPEAIEATEAAAKMAVPAARAEKSDDEVKISDVPVCASTNMAYQSPETALSLSARSDSPSTTPILSQMPVDAITTSMSAPENTPSPALAPEAVPFPAIAPTTTPVDTPSLAPASSAPLAPSPTGALAVAEPIPTCTPSAAPSPASEASLGSATANAPPGAALSADPSPPAVVHEPNLAPKKDFKEMMGKAPKAKKASLGVAPSFAPVAAAIGTPLAAPPPVPAASPAPTVLPTSAPVVAPSPAPAAATAPPAAIPTSPPPAAHEPKPAPLHDSQEMQGKVPKVKKLGWKMEQSPTPPSHAKRPKATLPQPREEVAEASTPVQSKTWTGHPTPQTEAVSAADTNKGENTRTNLNQAGSEVGSASDKSTKKGNATIEKVAVVIHPGQLEKGAVMAARAKGAKFLKTSVAAPNANVVKSYAKLPKLDEDAKKAEAEEDGNVVAVATSVVVEEVPAVESAAPKKKLTWQEKMQLKKQFKSDVESARSKMEGKAANSAQSDAQKEAAATEASTAAVAAVPAVPAVPAATKEEEANADSEAQPKPAKKFRPRGKFVVPPPEPAPPLQKAPKINLKQAPPIKNLVAPETDEPVAGIIAEESSMTSTDVATSSTTTTAETTTTALTPCETPAENQALKLQMVDPAGMLASQSNGQVEVDYTDFVTSAAQICLTPKPDTVKTVKWKNNMVSVSHYASQ